MDMYWSHRIRLEPMAVKMVAVIREPVDWAFFKDDRDHHPQLVGLFHDPAEHHGADHQRHGVHHGFETALGQQVVDRFHAAVAGIAAIGRRQQAAEGVALENRPK
jgi:hypothetical protein